MKRYSIRIAVAVFACLLGVIATTLKSRFSVYKSANISVLSSDERWHRVYEAAGMSGDMEIMSKVENRLLCTNRFGVPDAMPVEINARAWCQRGDGTIHELKANDTSEYGSFYRRVKSSHATWSLQNLDFIKNLNTADRAKQYVSSQWPKDGDGSTSNGRQFVR